ncbi:MAG: tetratricopeptide repeat protein [Candidatus Aminicenantes bacterium]|nr:tetratricopeptide repeat protein [Candidatus Aminicenantes bacterium]
MKKTSLLALTVLFLFSCSTQPKATPEQMASYEKKMREGESLTNKADYTSLVEAYQVYETLLSIPMNHRQTREKLLKTCLLLSMRQKELGILDETYLNRTRTLIESGTFPPEYRLALEIVEALPFKVKGITKDTILDEDAYTQPEKLEDKIPLWYESMKRRSGRDLLFTYLFLTLNCEFGKILEEKIDLHAFRDSYATTPLVLYRLSVCGFPDQEVLENMIEKAPYFTEAYFHLGEAFLHEGKLSKAEKAYLKAFHTIPHSTAVVISLANIYFILEELEKSISFYDKAITLAPEYRDALLGKAIALSYLGRHEEALDTLKKLYDLGKYFLGETHYWQAWNLRELGRLDKARTNIEKAKNYLIGHAEVFILAGKTALDGKNTAAAEENFKEALKIHKENCEALFFLGKVYALEENWGNSGLFYDRASQCYLYSEAALNEKIKEIETSGFSPERIHIYVLTKNNQIKQIKEKRASSDYNGALSYFYAGRFEDALGLARRAAEHPAFKTKAATLIEQIKEKR